MLIDQVECGERDRDVERVHGVAESQGLPASLGGVHIAAPAAMMDDLLQGLDAGLTAQRTCPQGPHQRSACVAIAVLGADGVQEDVRVEVHPM